MVIIFSINKYKKMLSILIFFFIVSNMYAFDMTIDEIKKSITESINDELWYKGQTEYYTPEDDFRNKKFTIYVYNSNSKQENLWIAFKFMNGKYKNKIYVLNYGYENRQIYLSPYWGKFVNKEQEIKEYIIKKSNDNNYKLIYTSEFEFGDPKRPVYLEITEEKRKIINAIYNKIYEWVTEVPGYLKGKYSAYIRNFKDNSSQTFIVLEGPKKLTEIFPLYIFIEEGEVFIDLRTKVTDPKYFPVELYMQDIVLKKEFIKN